MTIGPTLRTLRESADLTQEEVGKRMPTPITKQRIGAIESADDLQYSTVVTYLAAVGHEIQIIPSLPGYGQKSETMEEVFYVRKNNTKTTTNKYPVLEKDGDFLLLHKSQDGSLWVESRLCFNSEEAALAAANDENWPR